MKNHSQPRFDLKWAQTLDGQLSDDFHVSKWISSKEERVETHRLRREYDAVMVGASTFIKDLCKLTVRDCPTQAHEKQPVRIILDPRGRVQERLQRSDSLAQNLLDEILNNADRPTLLLAPKNKKVHPSFPLAGVFHEEFALDFEEKNFVRSLKGSLQKASIAMKRPLLRILVEGGPRLLSHFVKTESYMHAYVSISSSLTGGVKNRISAHRDLQNAIHQRVLNIQLVGSDLMLHLERGNP